MKEVANQQERNTVHIASPWAAGKIQAGRTSRFDLGNLFKEKKEVFLGRSPSNDIWLEHPAVSRIHASLRQGPDGLLIVRDLDSTHGITMDGRPVIGEAAWKPGAILHLGPQPLWLEEGPGLTVSTSRGGLGLEAHGLTVRVQGREKPILDGVSFTFKPGQFVCVLGPSGAGKSTLVQCLLGLHPKCFGSLLFDGNPILSNPTIFKGMVGYAPQRMSLHETLSTRQVVWYAAKLRLPTDTSPQEIENHVDNALDAMGIRHLANQRVANLSGGERKRVELASELVVDPSILLVDEATSSLDPASEARVMEVLARTARQGRLVLCVTHHLDNISKADTLLVLGQGKCVYLGPPGGACAHFGVENLADAFVRLEDEGPEKWARSEDVGESHSQDRKLSREKVEGNKPSRPNRSSLAGLREAFRQARVLTLREFASTWTDKRYLFLAMLMPVLFALIVFGGYFFSNLSNEVLMTRLLNEDEKKSFKVFWPIIHSAARDNFGEEEFLTLKAQLAFFLENRPEMRKQLADKNLDRIMQGAIDGTLDIFPEKFIKNHLTTLKYLSSQMMGLTFMGMLLGLTLMVRDGDIFPREKAAGIFPLSYLSSKVFVLVLATGFQTILFDSILEGGFLFRQTLNGLEPIPAEYRVGFALMVLIHWVATFACALLGVLIGTLIRKADRGIILMGAMMVAQLILGSALGLAADPVPRVTAFLISPTYWGLRATQISPMENGYVTLPPYLQVFGDSFIQSVPLALAGLLGQILLYLLISWWLLRSKPTVTQ